jgi:DNA-binding response OmpR family regulator
VALCERCGEEIAVANDLDLAGDVDRRRHLVMVAGSRRSLTATHWQIFHAALPAPRGCRLQRSHSRRTLRGPGSPERGANREHMRQLRKVLAGSRYQIVNYRSLGYELIIADTSDAPPRANRRP